MNFDTTPDSTPIPSPTLVGGLYADWGVTFGPTNLVCNWCGIATSPPNRCTPGFPSPAIDCDFPNGVSAVGAYGFDYVLTVFDRDGNPLGTCSYTDGSAGLYGGDRELAFLGLASQQTIFHARFSLYWTQQMTFGFEIDDLRFIPTSAETSTRQRSFGALKSLYR